MFLSLLFFTAFMCGSGEASDAGDINIKVSQCEFNETHYNLLQALQSQSTQQIQLLEEILSRNEEQAWSPPTNCREILQRGMTKSGVYNIQPSTYPEPFPVYCDMVTAGGGWTVFQRREDGAIGFYRNWADYKYGFGNVNSEFWLGNDKIFYLTAQGQYEGRVDLLDFEGETRFAAYNKFRVGDESLNYKLILGAFSGDAGDSLRSSNNIAFSTHDADHDTNDGGSCAVSYKGGWWYSACHGANLNGLYLAGEHESYANGVDWSGWKGYHYSLKQTEMKVRPVLSGE